jgi:hypothetical protein
MSDTQTIVFSKTFQLANADIIALPSSEFEIIPAPGSGKVILPISAAIITHFSDGDYVADADGYLEWKVGGNEVLGTIPNESNAGLTELDAFLQGNRLWYLIPQQKYIPALNTGWDSTLFRINIPENGAMTVDIDNNGAGNLTGGNSANYMKVTVNYTIIDL